MKPTAYTIFILFCISITISGQAQEGPGSTVQRLYNEIRNSYNVQSRYIGCYGHLSELFSKVDSLKKELGLNSFTEYFNDSSINLKYYAFCELLRLNDDNAFDALVKQSDNIDIINFEFVGQFRGAARLLELLTGEYFGYIMLKYYYGGRGTYHDRAYSGKRDRKTWKRKYAAVLKFMTDNNLSTYQVKDFTRLRSVNRFL